MNAGQGVAQGDVSSIGAVWDQPDKPQDRVAPLHLSQSKWSMASLANQYAVGLLEEGGGGLDLLQDGN